MATLLAPTQVTVPTGTTFYPSSTGTALPASLTEIDLTIDHTSMPVANTMTAGYEAQFAGDSTWYPFTSVTFNGGTVLHRGVQVGTSRLMMSLSPERYPTTVRIRTDNSPTSSPVTISGSAS